MIDEKQRDSQRQEKESKTLISLQSWKAGCMSGGCCVAWGAQGKIGMTFRGTFLVFRNPRRVDCAVCKVGSLGWKSVCVCMCMCVFALMYVYGGDLIS